MRYLLEQMPGVFFELYLLFIFSPEEKIKRQKSAAEQSWEMLVSQSCLPAWPFGDLGFLCNPLCGGIQYFCHGQGQGKRVCASQLLLGLGKTFL